MQKMIVPRFLNSGFDEVKRIGSTMSECGSLVTMAQCQDCGIRYYKGHNRCRQKFCSNCERKKSMIWSARIMERLKDEKKYNYYLLTLTIRDMADLGKMIKRLECAWRCFVHEDKNLRKLFKERFCGGVRSLEVKKGSGSGLWHCHYHVFLISKRSGRDIEWIKEAWNRITDGDGQQVDIRVIRKNKILDGLVETLKYITKFEDMQLSDLDLFDMVFELKGKRRINSFGILYGLGKQVDEDLDNVDKKEKVLTDFICELCGSRFADLIISRLDDVEGDYLRNYQSFQEDLIKV